MRSARFYRFTLATIAAVAILLGVSATPALAYSANDCSNAGGYIGAGQGILSNGTLTVGACVDSSVDLRRINIDYKKTGGSQTFARFGWQFVNDSAADVVVSTHWDDGAFHQNAGEDKYFVWNYADTLETFSSSQRCVRGILQSQSSFVLYITKTVCDL